MKNPIGKTVVLKPICAFYDNITKDLKFTIVGEDGEDYFKIESKDFQKTLTVLHDSVIEVKEPNFVFKAFNGFFKTFNPAAVLLFILSFNCLAVGSIYLYLASFKFGFSLIFLSVVFLSFFIHFVRARKPKPAVSVFESINKIKTKKENRFKKAYLKIKPYISGIILKIFLKLIDVLILAALLKLFKIF